MDCKAIRKIIPDYVIHQASEGDVQKVEEHLCICQDCRDYLSQLLDKKELQPVINEAPTPVDMPEQPSPKATAPAVVHGSPKQTERDFFSYIIVGVGVLIVTYLLILFFRAS